jgi:hypothetical protein
VLTAAVLATRLTKKTKKLAGVEASIRADDLVAALKRITSPENVRKITGENWFPGPRSGEGEG